VLSQLIEGVKVNLSNLSKSLFVFSGLSFATIVVAAVYFLVYPYGNVQLLPGTSVAAFVRENLNVTPALGDFVIVTSSDDSTKAVKMEYTGAGWVKTGNVTGQTAGSGGGSGDGGLGQGSGSGGGQVAGGGGSGGGSSPSGTVTVGPVVGACISRCDMPEPVNNP
jgi:uncharacterized membrane protein YgcG